MIALCGIPCSDAKALNNEQEIASYGDWANEIPFSHPDMISGSYSLYYQDFRVKYNND